MNTIKNYFFLFIFPIFLVSADVEEIVVQGDWRQSKLIEEDSSVLVLTAKELESAPIKHFLHGMITWHTVFINIGIQLMRMI